MRAPDYRGNLLGKSAKEAKFLFCENNLLADIRNPYWGIPHSFLHKRLITKTRYIYYLSA